MYAAQQGIPQTLNVKQHQYGFAFALTDFKLQGRTLDKLIISVCKRNRMPWMTLSSFYVLVSRVRKLSGLRLLQRDEKGIKDVKRQKPDEYLHAWEHGYINGTWNDKKAADALQEIRDKRITKKT